MNSGWLLAFGFWILISGTWFLTAELREVCFAELRSVFLCGFARKQIYKSLAKPLGRKVLKYEIKIHFLVRPLMELKLLQTKIKPGSPINRFFPYY
jgi:thiol:disulfide interchange protein